MCANVSSMKTPPVAAMTMKKIVRPIVKAVFIQKSTSCDLCMTISDCARTLESTAVMLSWIREMSNIMTL